MQPAAPQAGRRANMASSACGSELLWHRGWWLAAALLFFGVTWHAWYVIAEYVWFLLGSTLLQARLALSSGPVDTSWDGQADFVWKELQRQPLAIGTPQLVVDIGAHDGVWQSNSNLMLQHGWRAVLVEPHPSTYRQLLRNVGGKFGRRARLVRAAIGINGTEVSPGGGRATTRGWLDGTENRVVHANCTPTRIVGGWSRAAHRRYDGADACVPILPLPELLARLRVPRIFGLLSLDVEWSDVAVSHALRKLLRGGYRPEMLIVENSDKARPWLKQAYGYEHMLTARYDAVFRLARGWRPMKMAVARGSNLPGRAWSATKARAAAGRIIGRKARAKRMNHSLVRGLGGQ